MKKSLLITMEFPPFKGGVGNYLYNLANNLPPDDIAVLTEKTDDLPPDVPYRIFYKEFFNKFIWPRWIFLTLKIWKIVKSEQVNYLQIGQILPLGTVALILKKILKLPYLVYTYGMDLTLPQTSFRKKALLKSILSNADHIITISQYTKNELIKLGAEERKITIVYPCAHNQPITIKTEVSKKFISDNHLNDKKILLTVGRLVRRKGHEMVIRSLPEILKQVPNLTYLIIGQGPELNKLHTLVNELKLNEYVEFIEKIPDRDLSLFFYICDVFIMPSREITDAKTPAKDVEGFGIVFLEANLYGKPVIAGNTGGQPEAVQDGVNGLLVDPENGNEITQAAVKLLTNPSYAAQLGQQGKSRSLNDFQWPKEARKIMQLLK